MLAVIALHALYQVPSGAWALPELCQRLEALTGVAHTVDADLKDYPIFVASATGTPQRVEQLTALALRAEWHKIGDRLHLMPAKLPKDTGLVEFTRALKVACARNPVCGALPVKELYQLPVGGVLRFSFPETENARPLPESLRKTVVGSNLDVGFVTVVRQAAGIYFFRQYLPGSDKDGRVDLKSLSPAIEGELGQGLEQEALSPKDQQAIQFLAANPAAMKLTWQDLPKSDPTARLTAPALRNLPAVLERDVAIALPDLSFFAVQNLGYGSRTVRSVVENMGTVVDWAVEEGALVGKVPACDRISSPQVKREALGRILKTAEGEGMIRGEVLRDFVCADRQAAGNCFIDLMLLSMGGICFDEEYIADYPYNLRFWASLEQDDRKLLLAKVPFRVSDLSDSAQKGLISLLLYTNHNLEPGRTDPAYWRAFQPAGLEVTPVFSEETVLVTTAGSRPHIATAAVAAAVYDLRRRQIGQEPLYQVAVRSKLRFKIEPLSRRTWVETGLCDLKRDEKVAPCQWEQLPQAVRDDFAKALQSRREQASRSGGG